jgi:hypothetical protein
VSSIKIVYLNDVEMPEESPKAKAGALATSVRELDQMGLQDSKEDKCLVNDVPALVNLVPSANPSEGSPPPYAACIEIELGSNPVDRSAGTLFWE